MYRCLIDSSWTLTDRRLFWNWGRVSPEFRIAGRRIREVLTQIWTEREVMPSLRERRSLSSVEG